MLDKIRKSCGFSMSKAIGERAVKLQRCACEFKKEYGRFPSYDELTFLTGYNNYSIRSIMTMTYVDDTYYYEMEDDILDSLVKDYLVDNLNNELGKLKPFLKDTICKFNGYGSETYTQKELSEKYGVTQQDIRYRSKKAYQKVRKNAPFLRDYYAK